jgi:hypothetical protein
MCSDPRAARASPRDLRVSAGGELEEAMDQLATAEDEVRALRQRKDWGEELHGAEERERLAREAVARIRRRQITSGAAD